MDENKNKPIANIKVGSVRAAIWKNQRQNENGNSFESVKVVLDRTYKDRSGNYSSTHSLDANDIPKAARTRRAYGNNAIGIIQP